MYIRVVPCTKVSDPNRTVLQCRPIYECEHEFNVLTVKCFLQPDGVRVPSDEIELVKPDGVLALKVLGATVPSYDL